MAGTAAENAVTDPIGPLDPIDPIDPRGRLTGDGTPESVAVSGVPPAAEALPTVRDRLSATVAGILLLFAGGFGLLITALLAGEQATTVAATTVSGALVIALAICAVTGIFNSATIAIAGAAVGAGLILSGLLANPMLLPDWGRLLVGGMLGLSSVGTIATIARGGRQRRQPEPRVEAG